jgi:hypothetical protein
MNCTAPAIRSFGASEDALQGTCTVSTPRKKAGASALSAWQPTSSPSLEKDVCTTRLGHGPGPRSEINLTPSREPSRIAAHARH